jgi:hypothetical protein
MQAAEAGTAASAPKGTSDGLPELAQDLMAKASDMSNALAEQHAQPTLRCAAQLVHQTPHAFHHAALPGSSFHQQAIASWARSGLASLHICSSCVHAAALHCSQRQEHTSRLLEAATQQAEDAGISDEEPDVQLALMAAEMRCR